MGYQSRTLSSAETYGRFGVTWDRIPASRGVQADIFCTHAWFGAWLRAVDHRRAARVRVPAVLDDDLPVALLPLARRGWLWEIAGAQRRPRSRVVVAGEQPDPEHLGCLAEQVGRSDVKELLLPRMPTRDPATGGLIRALADVGYRVTTYERATDNVALVDGNPAFAKHLRRFAQSARNLERRIDPFWEVRIDDYGRDYGKPLEEGWALARAVQERSWKGASTAVTDTLRGEFLQRADALGWVRLSILALAGEPAAMNVTFRIGSVLFGLSTAYDQRLLTYGPGSILHAHMLASALAAHQPPDLVDFLPGQSPWKDRFRPEQPPLVTVEACRPTLVRGASFAPRTAVRHTWPRAWSTLRSAVTHRPALTTSERSGRVTTVYRPAAAPSERIIVTRLEPDTALRRYIAAASGYPSAEAASTSWGAADTWVHLQGPVPALVRLRHHDSDPPRAMEILRLASVGSAEQIIGHLAAGMDSPIEHAVPDVQGRGGLPMHTPPLPWRHSLLDGSRIGEPT